MSNTNHRPAAPASSGPTLAGIIACLGALVDEAHEIGDMTAAEILQETVQKLKNRRNFIN